MAGSKQRYTREQVVAALEKTKGMVYLAAKVLGCSYVTVYNYAKRYKSVQQAIDANRGEVIDAAELKLYNAILAGEHWAVAFALKTIGKHRGYVEKQAVDLKTDGELRVTYIDDWRDKAPKATPGTADSDARPGKVQMAGSGAAVAQDDDGNEHSG